MQLFAVTISMLFAAGEALSLFHKDPLSNILDTAEDTLKALISSGCNKEGTKLILLQGNDRLS